MSGTGPPSFSSFPDVASTSRSKPKPLPPSFSSFPESAEPSRRQLQLESATAPVARNEEASRPSKRARATDFLNQLGQELGVVNDVLPTEHKSSGDGVRDRDSERHRSKKDKGKERASDSDRERHRKDHRRGDEKRRKESSTMTGGAWKRDSEYGPQVSRSSA